jgi:hypothetical protein
LAISRAVPHLKQFILQGDKSTPGDWRGQDVKVGQSALVGLALLEAGVPPSDPAIQEALARVRLGGPQLRFGYAQCVVLFFLDRLHEAEPLRVADRELLRSIAVRLIAGQVPEGHWTYVNPPLAPKEEEALLLKLYANKYTPQNFKQADPSPPDNSTTHFTLLALWVARRHNVPVRPPLLAVAASFHRTQYADGTWTYEIEGGNKRCTDSSTCAGLLALAMEKALREDKEYKNLATSDPPADPKADEHRDKAFAHLAKVYDRNKGKADAAKRVYADALGDIYFLWCLERVAVIYDLKEIGGRDWYAWGSDILVQYQRDDGIWSDAYGIADTCFAILFLTKANMAKDLTESIRSRGN